MEEKNVFDELLTLLENKEYTKLRESLSEHNDADIAAWMEELSEEHMLKLFRILTKDQAADVFSYLDVDLQQRIIGAMSDKEAAGIMGIKETTIRSKLTSAKRTLRRDHDERE